MTELAKDDWIITAGPVRAVIFQKKNSTKFACEADKDISGPFKDPLRSLMVKSEHETPIEALGAAMGYIVELWDGGTWSGGWWSKPETSATPFLEAFAKACHCAPHAGQAPPVEPMVSLSRVREAVLSVLDDGDLYEWLEGCDAGTVIRDDQRNEVADRVLARLQQHPISSEKGAERDGVFRQIDAAAKGYDTERVTAELKDFFTTEDPQEE